MLLWLASRPLLLASKSAARRALLEAASIPVEIEPAEIDERAMETRAGLEDAEMVAALLAREKAKAVAKQHPGRLVLGADQTLALGERRFSKASDRAGTLRDGADPVRHLGGWQLRVRRGRRERHWGQRGGEVCPRVAELRLKQGRW